MKTYVLVYEGFAHFEVILASYFLKTQGEIVTVGLSNEIITSGEGFQIKPHKTLEEVVCDEVDVFIVPGGDPKVLYDVDELYLLLKALNEKEITIGAICAGPVHLAKAGILENKEYTTSLDVNTNEYFDADLYVNENVVIDENIITAKPTGYVDFGLHIGDMMDIYEDEDDRQETINFFKYFTFEEKQ